jgi:hypothetical protein
MKGNIQCFEPTKNGREAPSIEKAMYCKVGRGDEAAAGLGEKAKAESDENEGSAASRECRCGY